MPANERIAKLMSRFRQGDSVAAGELVHLLYPELRRLAAAQMRSERRSHTWQPTVLVNELYLELVRVKALRSASQDGTAERDAFLRLAAHMMKRLLIHHARPLAKRVERTDLVDDLIGAGEGLESVAQIENALTRLGGLDERFREIVYLRVFEGLTLEEAADRMGISRRTAARCWAFAQKWLSEEWAPPLDGNSSSSESPVLL